LPRGFFGVPDNADNHGWLVLGSNCLREGDDLIRLIQRAMTLNPRHSWNYV